MLVPPEVRRRSARTEIGWQQCYAWTVRGTDVVALATAVLIGLAAPPQAGETDGSRLLLAAVAATLCLAGLGATRAWEARVMGNGAEEYRRVFRSFGGAAVALGLAGLALHLPSVRVWVFGFVPLAGLLCVLARQVLRTLLHRWRRRQRCMRRILAVGDEANMSDLVRRTLIDPGFGWQVVALCTSTRIANPELAAVPVVGDLDEVASAALAHRIDVVAVAPAPGWGPRRLQQLAWDLEGSGVELAVAPALTEIAGPRLHVTPIDGMPLLRLSKPRLGGGIRLVKDLTDRVGAAALLIGLAPLFLLLVAAVGRDRGPVFDYHDRVGKRGRPFRMMTFRVTPTWSDRPTAVGALLLSYSLEGLPRLLNVLGGSMSLIGPQPLHPTEVAAFGPDAWSRLLIKPGMLGTWQFAADDQLPWEESARLSLRYVEHWSATEDLSILWRNLNAWVLRRRSR